MINIYKEEVLKIVKGKSKIRSEDKIESLSKIKKKEKDK